MKNYYLLFIAMIAAFAGVLFGYGTGVISGAILFISKEFNSSSWINGVVVGSALLGAVLGAFVSGRIGDSFGHKRLLIIAALIFLLGSIESALSPTIALLLLGRLCVGASVGIVSYVAPLYISEIASPQHRGALVSLNQLAIGLGVLISYIVAYYFSTFESWRWMLGLGAVPAVFFLVGVTYLPHSPRWALAKGFEDEAITILKKIRGQHAEISEEFLGIKSRLSEGACNTRELFSHCFRRILLLGLGLAIVQQITGINIIVYYAPTILMGVFHGEMQAITATIYIGLIFIVATIFSMTLLDRYGRRILLIAGLLGMSICLAALSWAFGHQHIQFVKPLIVISMCLYIISFAFSLGPIAWLMIAEIFPLRVRGAGASLATAANWTSNFIITATFLQLTEFIGIGGTFTIYFLFCLLSLLFVYFFVPETKGLSLEEIEKSMVNPTCPINSSYDL